jgi:hypothetical protein
VSYQQEAHMGTVIDCRSEFAIRQDLNRLNRAVKQINMQNRIAIVINEDETKPEGLAYYLYDTVSGESIKLDRDMYYQSSTC